MDPTDRASVERAAERLSDRDLADDRVAADPPGGDGEPVDRESADDRDRERERGAE